MADKRWTWTRIESVVPQALVSCDKADIHVNAQTVALTEKLAAVICNSLNKHCSEV